YVGEAQEIERLGFPFTPTYPVLFGKPPEFDPARLIPVGFWAGWCQPRNHAAFNIEPSGECRGLRSIGPHWTIRSRGIEAASDEGRAGRSRCGEALSARCGTSRGRGARCFDIRIRHFGFLTNRPRTALLPLCFQLLGTVAQSQIEQESSVAKNSSSPWRCPKCGGEMVVIERLTAAQIQLRSPPWLAGAAA